MITSPLIANLRRDCLPEHQQRARTRHSHDRRPLLRGRAGAARADARIASSAPLARALMGAGAGETVDFAGVADAIEVIAVGAIEAA